LAIAADNLKFCGAVVGSTEVRVDALAEVRAADFEAGKQVVVALDHHNPVPDEARGKVGAELVLHYKDQLIGLKNQALQNGYEVLAVSHNAPYDPDAMISQWLIKEIVRGNIGEGRVEEVYANLAQYAKITDFYQFVFSPDQHLTLRGVCDGLAKLYGDKPELLALRSDDILNWVKENKLDPNDYQGFRDHLAQLRRGRYAFGSIEQLIQTCIHKKEDALARARELYDASETFEITLADNSGSPIRTKVVLIDSLEARKYFKEIDDVAYSQDGLPVVIIKESPDGQWWVCMRPTNHNTEEGAQSDPILQTQDEPTFAFAPATAGFHEQVVRRLPGEAGKNWAIWPYNGTAQVSNDGRYATVSGREIAEALL